MANDDDTDVIDQAPSDETADEREVRIQAQEAQRYSDLAADERGAGSKLFQGGSRTPFQPVAQQQGQPPAEAVAGSTRQPFQPAPTSDLGPPPEAAAAQQAWQYASAGGGAPRAQLVKSPPPPIQAAWEQAQAFKRQGELDTLNGMFRDAQNLPDLYRRLDQPMPGTFDQLTGTNVGAVSDPVRLAARNGLQEEITKLAQDQYGLPNDPDHAFQMAMQEPGFGDYVYETGKKLYGSVMSYLDTMQKGAVDTDQLALDQAVDQMVPERGPEAPAVSPEAAVTGVQIQATKDALKADLLKADPNTRAQMLSAYLPYATVDPNTGQVTPPADPAVLVPAIERLADPRYQAAKAQNRANVSAAAKWGLQDDLQLQGTAGEAFADAIGQMLPQVVASRLLPPLVYKQIFDQERERIAAQNPELSDTELDNRAMQRAVALTAGTEIAGHFMGAGGGALTAGIKGRVQQALARVGVSAATGSASMATAQAAANVLSQEPIGAGVGQQALVGGIAGAAGALPGAGAELVRPRAPELTTGPSGARIRGPEESTLEKGQVQAEQPPPAVPEQVAPPAPEVQPQPETPVETPPPEAQPPLAEALPQPQPVTREDVARRAYELSEERVRNGQPGSPLDDWTRAQLELAQPTEQALPATLSEAEPINSAIANRYTAERMASGELGQVDPSQGKSTEELMQQGLKMNPTQRDGLIDNLMKGKGGNLDQQAAAIRSKEAILSEQSKAASRAATADPANVQLQAQAKAALDAVTDFHNGPVKKLKQTWSDTGRGLQQEIPLDYTTINGLKEAYLKGNGKEVPSALEPKLKQMADRVSKSVDAERQALNGLGQEIQKRTRGKPLPTSDQVRTRLMEIMKDLPCPR